MEEEWRPVKGYEGLYEVSNMGRVKSLRYGKSRILKQGVSSNGHMKVDLKKDGIPNRQQVHRLVAEAFMPNPMNLPVVNHLDGDKHNNCVSNLEWCTYRQNTLHAYHNGLMNSEALKKSVILYKRCGEYKSITEAAKALGVTQGGLSNAIRKDGFIHDFIAVIEKDTDVRYGVKINIYNDKLEFLGQVPSVSAAARFTKVSVKMVTKCCREKVFSKGYTFRFFDDAEISSKKEG